MRVYNTLTRQKEDLIPLEEGKIRLYACGPTVYNYFHIGNARCFVLFDLLRRYLEYRGNKVTFVQNFTDIPDNCTAVGIPARVVRRDGEKVQDLDQIHIPDPVAQEIRRLEERIEQLEKMHKED